MRGAKAGTFRNETHAAPLRDIPRKIVDARWLLA